MKILGAVCLSTMLLAIVWVLPYAGHTLQQREISALAESVSNLYDMVYADSLYVASNACATLEYRAALDRRQMEWKAVIIQLDSRLRVAEAAAQREAGSKRWAKYQDAENARLRSAIEASRR